jgi:hypothetical protein
MPARPTPRAVRLAAVAAVALVALGCGGSISVSTTTTSPTTTTATTTTTTSPTTTTTTAAATTTRAAVRELQGPARLGDFSKVDSPQLERAFAGLVSQPEVKGKFLGGYGRTASDLALALIALDVEGGSRESLSDFVDGFLSTGGTADDKTKVVDRRSGGIPFKCGPITAQGLKAFCAWQDGDLFGLVLSTINGPDVDGTFPLSTQAQPQVRR